MDNGESLPSNEGVATSFARLKAQKGNDEMQGLPPDPSKAAAARKQGEVLFKAAHAILIAFLTWILVLHILGIYLFTTGFLLTRLVLEHKSDCSVPPIDTLSKHSPGSYELGCWHPKTFDKAIVIIIDALRYDFTVPFHPEGFETTNHFHNAISVLHETASNTPKNAFLLPFIADPPTATLQRLKGLTTGTLPTFVDLGSNFAGTAIDEDNIVAQLRNANSKIVQLGDDTWQSLYPGYFEPNLTRAYDSFNVWDLHTVDNGVTEHIFPLLHPSNTTRWDVIIGHYLGVDHAGHRYGPDHPAMTSKLNQMDRVIRRIIQELDDSTLLIVMGDHGMDVKGDHGGESDDEIQAALWMYAKQEVFGRSSPTYNAPPATAKERPVSQIDLVPTLSLLLGLPIPFNSLGTPIEEAFIGANGQNWENLAIVNRIAAAQIHRYQQEYTQARGLDESSQTRITALWNAANAAWSTTGGSHHNRFKEAYFAFLAYERETLSTCRELWARFDVLRMLNGVTILVFAFIVLGLYARGLDGDRSELTPILLFRGGIGTIFGVLLGLAAIYTSPSLSRDHSIVLATALGSVSGVTSAFWHIRPRLTFPFPTSLWGWLSVVFTVSLSAGFAANSFTIWEDEILLHFLCTFGAFATLSSFRQKETIDRVLGCYHSILFIFLCRLASFSRLCREEQMPYCKSTYYASATSSTSAIWQLFIPFAVAFLLPSFLRSYYTGTRNFQGTMTLWVDFVLRFGLLLGAAYWTLDAADDGEWYPGYNDMLKTTKVFIAQLTLAIALAFGYSLYSYSKPFLNMETRVIPRKGTSEQIASDESKTSIAILGYANVHGSRYSFLVTMWFLAVALMQKPMGFGAIGITIWQIFSLFEIIDTNKLSDSAIGPVVLGLLGSFHYFKTGHQAVLSSIQWESAFLPLRTIKYPWSPLLVILNAFGAQILCTVAVPTLVLWKQHPKKRGLLGDVAKAIATHSLFYAIINVATTMWAGHLRRHLMLYRVFNPRFMLGAVVLLVVDIVGAFIALGGARISFLSVAEVFGWS